MVCYIWLYCYCVNWYNNGTNVVIFWFFVSFLFFSLFFSIKSSPYKRKEICMENSFYTSFSFSLLENTLQLWDRAMTVNFCSLFWTCISREMKFYGISGWNNEIKMWMGRFLYLNWGKYIFWVSVRCFDIKE